MFEDKKHLSTFLIGISAGIFMVMIANAAVAGGESAGCQVAFSDINLGAAIVGGIFLIVGLFLGLPFIKEDKGTRIEIIILLLITFIFMIAFAIVSAL